MEKDEKEKEEQYFESYPGDKDHPENKKREYDPEFKGVVKDRSCTDILCLLIFIVAIILEIIVAVFAFKYGDPSILIHPTDYKGNLCGVGALKSKKYLMYFDVTQCARAGPVLAIAGCPTTQICVEKCPTENWVFASLQAEEAATGKSAEKRKQELICKYDYDKSNTKKSILELVKDEDCAPYYLKSKHIAKRCVPEFIVDSLTDFSKFFEKNRKNFVDKDGKLLKPEDLKDGNVLMNKFLKAAQTATTVGKELKDGLPWIILVIIIGALLSLIWCFLMEHFASILSVLTLILCLVAFAFGTIYSTVRYFSATTSANGKFVIYRKLSNYTQLKEFWLGMAIVCAIALTIVLLVMIYLRSRIRLAIAIIDEASKVIGAMMSTLFFPLVPLILDLLVLGFWIVTSIYLLSVVKKEYKTIDVISAVTENNNTLVKECDPSIMDTQGLKCNFQKYTNENWAFYLNIYNTFMSFWLFAFFSGLCQIILAGAFCSWYWAWEKPKDVPKFPLLNSLTRVLRYHVGTVAFGSLIIAIVMIIRTILMYIRKKLNGSGNSCAKFCICLCQCCFWCLEKILRFVTKNAYIVTAMLGKSFCPAAANGFFLIARNCLRLAVVDNVSSFVLFVGKLMVAAIIGVISFFMFSLDLRQYHTLLPTKYDHYYIHIIVCVVVTYFIASLFFNVFDFAVDTLFICLMEDLERNDGTESKPYYMSKSLMEVLDKKNKFIDGNREPYCSCCPCSCC